jgi:predicted acylesterase/phospholipase RssA
MNVQAKPNVGGAQRSLAFERIALVLQGGGALGAYQAGVYEALSESRIEPDWIAGISIGGINAAIIAGNPPNMRLHRLREFWTQVTSDAVWNWFGWRGQGDGARKLLNHFSANLRLRRAPRVSSRPGRFHRGCSRRARLRQPAFTIPANSSLHWSAWSISTESTRACSALASVRSTSGPEISSTSTPRRTRSNQST